MPRFVLRSVQTNSGFLENATLTFADGLNCIIGARGTCKTTVVESIRFAFDSDPDAIAKITKPADRDTGRDEGVIPATLGSGSVTCVIDAYGDGTVAQYTVQREVDAPPRVLRDANRDPLPQHVLREIEIYSQGELQLIASENYQQKRLSLIDRTNRERISALARERSNLAEELKLLGGRLRLVQNEIEKRRLHVRDVAQVRADLAQVKDARPELPPSLEQQHDAFIARQLILEVLNELRGLQATASDALSNTATLQDDTTKVRDRLLSIEGIETTKVLLLITELEVKLGTIRELQVAIDGVGIAETRNAFVATFESLDDAYYEQRQMQQTVSESLKREETLRRRLQDIEKLERELVGLDSQKDVLLARRQQLRARLVAIRDEIFELRVGEASRINDEFGDVILLTVRRSTYSAAYIEKLTTLIGGSRIRSQDEIANELATHFLPNDLLDIIEAGAAQRVASLLGRDLGQMTRAVTYLRDHADLYDLEGESGDDSLDITMFDNGIPKQVEQLSKGQRATALLPLILRGSSCPLIIDQPEDDLDNSFIYQALVRNVRALKSRRQLIFVTHNANIPVLGNADAVIVMEMATPTKAAPPRSGSLDDRKQDVLDLLEGGKEAFEQREQRYHDLLA